jgi:hypothetical protein
MSYECEGECGICGKEIDQDSVRCNLKVGLNYKRGRALPCKKEHVPLCKKCACSLQGTRRSYFVPTVTCMLRLLFRIEELELRLQQMENDDPTR